MKIKIIVALIAAVAVAVFKTLAHRRAAQAEARGGCVSCGSTQLRAEGDAVICTQCGYTGRADGGGRLTKGEIDSMYDGRS